MLTKILKEKAKALPNGTYRVHDNELFPIDFTEGYLVGFYTNPVQTNIDDFSLLFKQLGFELFVEKCNNLIEESLWVKSLDLAKIITKAFNQYCIWDYKNKVKIYNPFFNKDLNNTGE